jgi:hypothetical protein
MSRNILQIEEIIGHWQGRDAEQVEEMWNY